MSMSASTPNTEAEPVDDGQVLDIAVGILRDARGRVLIAQRRPGTLGAGYWEFPGGKHEPGETIETTLIRELQEELGITPHPERRLVRMRNPAAMRAVRLHVWLITDWHGTPYGREGQRVTWCPQAELADWNLLPGNRALLNALGLPDRLAITPDFSWQQRGTWFAALDALLARDIELLRVRAPALDDADYAELARQVLERARDSRTRVLLDRSTTMVRELGAAGLQWPARRAAKAGQRPLGPDFLFCVSTHDAAEMRTAVRLEADFAVLSLVHRTPTHPEQQPLGWSGWQRLRSDYGLPVYALGGLSDDEVDTARANNAQGIAGIRAFWET